MNSSDKKLKSKFLISLESVIKDYRDFLRKVGGL